MYRSVGDRLHNDGVGRLRRGRLGVLCSESTGWAGHGGPAEASSDRPGTAFAGDAGHRCGGSGFPGGFGARRVAVSPARRRCAADGGQTSDLRTCTRCHPSVALWTPAENRTASRTRVRLLVDPGQPQYVARFAVGGVLASVRSRVDGAEEIGTNWAGRAVLTPRTGPGSVTWVAPRTVEGPGWVRVRSLRTQQRTESQCQVLYPACTDHVVRFLGTSRRDSFGAQNRAVQLGSVDQRSGTSPRGADLHDVDRAGVHPTGCPAPFI